MQQSNTPQTSALPQVPTAPLVVMPSSAHPKNSKFFSVLIGFLILAIILTVGAIAYMLIYKKSITTLFLNTDNTSNIEPTSLSDSSLTAYDSISPTLLALSSNPTTMLATINPSQYEIYYRTDNGIYAYSIKSNNSVQIFDSNDSGFMYPLGGNYFALDQFSGGSNDSASVDDIYVFNLLTGASTHLKSINDTTDTFYYILNFFNQNDMALIKEVDTPDGGGYTNVRTAQISLSGNAYQQVGSVIAQPERGAGYAGDSQRSLVSPDGNNLAFNLSADTSTLYLMNLGTKSMKSITNANMPIWLDNTTLIYQSLTDKRLYEYSLLTSSSTLYNSFTMSMNDVYGLRLLNRTFVYWRSNGNVYTFDLDSQRETAIISNATDAHWVNANYITYSALSPCVDSTTVSCTSMYLADNVWVYNVNTGAKVKVASTSNYSVLNDRGVYSCEDITCSD